MICVRCGRKRHENPRHGLCGACYQRDRRAGLVDPLVSSHSARRHIDLLVFAGWRYREIARAAHIDRGLLRFIVLGRQQIQAKTAVAICGIGLGDRDQYIKHVDPELAYRRARLAAASLTAESKAERSRKAWITRHRNIEKTRAAQALARQHAVQHSRQQAIMARRRREAAHQHRLAHPPAPLLIELPGSWVDDALCAQVDPEIFFPEKGGQTHAAKRVCMECTVRQECLDWALTHHERYGVWGGVSEKPRRAMMRRATA